MRKGAIPRGLWLLPSAVIRADHTAVIAVGPEPAQTPILLLALPLSTTGF